MSFSGRFCNIELPGTHRLSDKMKAQYRSIFATNKKIKYKNCIFSIVTTPYFSLGNKLILRSSGDRTKF
jgi:hypothetical protein